MRPALPVLLGCLLLAGCGPVPTATTTAAPDPAAPADRQVAPRDGDTVSGSGRVVQEPGGPVLFCGNEFVADVGYPPGQEPPPRACPDGVPLLGVDLAALTQRFEKAGAVEGQAALTGTWRAGTVEVTEQGPPDRNAPEPYGFREVPCAEPPGGWPVTSESDNMDAEQARVSQSGRIRVGTERFALLRPSKDQVLLGYTVPDEASRARAQAALDELVPGRGCVVVARHTDAQVQAASSADWSRFSTVRGYGIGLTRMQAVLQVSALVVTEPLAAAVAEHPPGLVALLPDLRVVARADPEPPAPSPPAPSPSAPSPSAESGASGRAESLDCGAGDRSAGLVVDRTADAAGHATPRAAAHALADERGLARERYTEREAEGPLGQPVFEYLTGDGRVVAYVTVGRWAEESWMASGLTVCQSAYG